MKQIIKHLAQRVLASAGLKLTRIQNPNGILDPVQRSIARGLSHREYNQLENIEAIYADKHILTHYFTPERLAFFPRVRKRLEKLKLHPCNVLDVGCGAGQLLAEVRRLYPEARFLGIDFSTEAIKIARRLYPRVEFQAASIFELHHLFNEKFALVLCTEVLEHLERPDEALRELLSVCSEDGLIFISVPNGRSDTFAGHVNFWTAESFAREFRALSPQIEQTEGNLFIVMHASSTESRM